MRLIYNNSYVNDWNFGSDNIAKVYYGVTNSSMSGRLVYQKVVTSDVPTPFQGKWLATYSGGTTSSAECDSSSAITSGEITLTDLTEVEIGDCVTSIGNDAFLYCFGLTSCTIGNGVTSIGDYAFNQCSSLTSIDIPSGVTSIGGNAFTNCSGLTSIDIPDSVTSIGGSAFYYCTRLSSCTIGSGVTSIGGNAFRKCSNLTGVTIYATMPPTLGSYAFDSTNKCPIYVPAASVNAYKAASGWSTYASRIQAIQ